MLSDSERSMLLAHQAAVAADRGDLDSMVMCLEELGSMIMGLRKVIPHEIDVEVRAWYRAIKRKGGRLSEDQMHRIAVAWGIADKAN